jgi:oxygen-independent coproporphyrinogen-3 oxidase
MELMPAEFPVPRAAYVHVPFCRHRCGYCNFTLVAGRDDLIDDYLRAIELELRTLGEPHEVDTLFFGGGTPTHLSPAKMLRLFDTVRDWFPLADGYEFSVEGNPDDLNDETLAALAAGDVNRVSLGGQSFSCWNGTTRRMFCAELLKDPGKNSRRYRST